jgi:hypothetical protein
MRAFRSRNLLSPLVLVSAILALYRVNGGAAPTGATPQVTRSDAERRAHMQAHFSQVMTVHEAVIRGDLAAATPPAAWLANHDAPSSLPAGSARFVAEMRRAARRTAGTSSILEAALGTADMLKTCGDCHRAMGTMPAVAIEPPRPEVHGLVGHMLAHQQAADQMLQALVVPSNALWRAGARALETAPLRPDTLPRDRKLSDAIVASEKRLHELASQAGRAEDSGARAVFYGQILSRCANCHALHPGVWGPTRRKQG